MPSERFGPRQRARLEETLRLRPPERTLRWSEVAGIDDERLWWSLRALDRDALMILFARALAEVPPHRLENVLGGYVRPGDIGATCDQARAGVLVLAEKFYDLARRGHFFEDMEYRGKQQSSSTELFVAQFTVLMQRCVEDSPGSPAEASAAFDMLFDLMRRIDAGEGIVCFTDEHGSWQLHVRWPRVVPAYFRCLARTVGKDEYDRRVDALVRDFGDDLDMKDLAPRALANSTWEGRSG